MIPALDLLTLPRILQFWGNAKERWTLWYTRCSRLKSTDQVLTSNQTQNVLKFSLEFVFSFVSGHWMIYWFRAIDYWFRFSFHLLTFVKFLHFLDNDDRKSSKRRNLSALVFLINWTTKVNPIRNLQKVWDLVKNHGKWSLWPKLATLQATYHVLGFSSSV